MMSETTSTRSYRRGVGHVLAEGHDPSTCTACAYDAGRRDAHAELARERQQRAVRLCRGCGHHVGTHAEGGCVALVNLPREACGCEHFDAGEEHGGA